MTILTIDDELGRRAREAAAAQGKTLEEFVGDVLQRALSPTTDYQLAERNGLAVIRVSEGTPTIDPERIRQCIEEEGF